MRQLVLLLMISLSFGCSAVMATKQPDKKDMTVLETGTERYRVIAEFGEPLLTEKDAGQTADVFKFVQGYSAAAKTGRAVAHGAATVYTLGLWEVFGTSIEGAADGKELQIRVLYDEANTVVSYEVLND